MILRRLQNKKAKAFGLGRENHLTEALFVI
jgi:hypothetical protein